MNRRGFLSALAAALAVPHVRPLERVYPAVAEYPGIAPRSGLPRPLDSMSLYHRPVVLCASCGQFRDTIAEGHWCIPGLRMDGQPATVIVVNRIADTAPTSGPPDLPRFGGPRA